MQKISGLIIDVHDDYQGDVLRSLFPSMDAIPELVKSASALSPGQRDALPDDAFALVMLDGDTKLRKFACHDAGNTALSVLYFLKTAHKLPEEAKTRAAENLKIACSWYDLGTTAELDKLAGLVDGDVNEPKYAGMVDKAMFALQLPGTYSNTKQNIQSNMSKIRAGEAAGNMVVPLGGAGHAKHAEWLRDEESDERDSRRTRRMLAGTTLGAGAGILASKVLPGAGAGNLALAGGGLGTFGGFAYDQLKEPGVGLRTKEDKKEKKAEVTGTVEGPVTAPSTSKRHFPIRKTAHMRPVVDVTGKDPVGPSTEKRASVYALDNRYPLDSYAQVKAASAYFEEYWKRFTPEDRREYSTKVAARAEELNIEIGETLAAYAGQGYAPDDMLKVSMSCRMSVLQNEDHKDLLEALFEKKAELDPELFAEALGQFDKIAGLDRMYDRDVIDPFRSTFAEKVAEDKAFKEVIGNDYVTGDSLKRFARSQRSVVEKMYGDDFAEEFLKDPIGIYKSLPMEQRKVIARMANDDLPINVSY